MKIIPLASAFVALALLAGCSGALKSTEPRNIVYTLRPAESAPDADKTPGAARIVEIAVPQVPPGFETDRIALAIQGGRKLDYYAGAKWPDILDSVLQDTIRRSARNVLPNVVAITPTQGMDGQFRLQTKINEFQPVYDDAANVAPDLRVNVEFTLVALPDNKIVSSFILTRNQRASSNTLDAAAGGLESMFQEVLTEAFTRLDTRLSPRTTKKDAPL